MLLNLVKGNIQDVLFYRQRWVHLCNNKDILYTWVQQVCGVYSEGTWFVFP